MTETPVVFEESNVTIERALKMGILAEQSLLEQSTPSIYAAYWHARSGFFKLASNPPEAHADLVKSGADDWQYV